MPPNPFTNPYQVQSQDRDFLTLAANLKVDYNQLRQANPFVQSLSQGQFINVPNQLGGVGNTPYGPAPAPATAITPPAGTPGRGQTWIQQAANSAGTPSMGVSNTVGDITRPPSAAYNAYGPGRGRRNASTNVPSVTSPGRDIQAYREAAYEMQRQIEAGMAPDRVPAALLGALGATPQSMLANGYVYDARTGEYTSPAAAQKAAMTNDPLAGQPGHYYVDEKTAPLVGQIITRADGSRRRLLTDKNGRLYYGKIGQNRRGREKRRAQRLALEQAQIVPTPEVRDAPVTALNVIMGS